MKTCAPKLGEVWTTGSFVKPQRAVNKVYVHCSAASRTTVDAVEVNQWHLNQGWDCIGYHFFIKTDGTVQYGRDIERTPAAQGGHNTGTIAICLNGLNVKEFTDAQFAALNVLCSEINETYKTDITFHGHREVAAKSCPVFDYMFVLNLDDEGHMIKGGPYEI